MKKQGKKIVAAAPVEKNQELLLTIDDLGSKGEGVGRYEGFTIFVEGALPGEVVWVRIVQVRKNFAFGKLLKVMEPSLTVFRSSAGLCKAVFSFSTSVTRSAAARLMVTITNTMDTIIRLERICMV